VVEKKGGGGEKERLGERIEGVHPKRRGGQIDPDHSATTHKNQKIGKRAAREGPSGLED